MKYDLCLFHFLCSIVRRTVLSKFPRMWERTQIQVHPIRHMGSKSNPISVHKNTCCWSSDGIIVKRIQRGREGPEMVRVKRRRGAEICGEMPSKSLFWIIDHLCLNIRESIHDLKKYELLEVHQWFTDQTLYIICWSCLPQGVMISWGKNLILEDEEGVAATAGGKIAESTARFSDAQLHWWSFTVPWLWRSDFIWCRLHALSFHVQQTGVSLGNVVLNNGFVSPVSVSDVWIGWYVCTGKDLLIDHACIFGCVRITEAIKNWFCSIWQIS